MSSSVIGAVVSPASVWRLRPGQLTGVLIVAVLSLFPFWDGLSHMWGSWVDSAEYSHGLLIPPVAAFLIWQQKHNLERINFAGSWWGVAAVLLGGATLMIGQLSTIYTIVQYAYVLTICGLVLSFVGWTAFRLVAVPMLLLLLMIPLPQFILANLSTKLQLLSSQIGVAFISAFGVSVFLEGNVIDLGGYKLQVAEACSGLRYLFPLMTMGFLIAYFYKGATWKRLLLFLSSIPITVIMNSLRIGVIGVTVDRWGTQMAEGFLHEFQGWLMFMASAALLLGEVVLLNGIGREKGTWRQLIGVEFPAPTPQGAVIRSRRVPGSFIAAGLLLIGFVIADGMVLRPAEVFPARTAFVEFPMRLGPWVGRRSTLEAVFTDQLKLDDYILADYADNAGGAANLYVAYYNSQRKGEAVHSPRSCLPGGGWQIDDFRARTLSGVVVDGRPLHVNRAIVELGSQRQLVYYWFQQRGRIIDNEFAVKWYLFWDALTRHRTDGAMVRLITPLSVTASEFDADRRLGDLAGQIGPLLPRYVPN